MRQRRKGSWYKMHYPPNYHRRQMEPNPLVNLGRTKCSPHFRDPPIQGPLPRTLTAIELRPTLHSQKRSKEKACRKSPRCLQKVMFTTEVNAESIWVGTWKHLLLCLILKLWNKFWIKVEDGTHFLQKPHWNYRAGSGRKLNHWGVETYLVNWKMLTIKLALLKSRANLLFRVKNSHGSELAARNPAGPRGMES